MTPFERLQHASDLLLSMPPAIIIEDDGAEKVDLAGVIKDLIDVITDLKGKST